MANFVSGNLLSKIMKKINILIVVILTFLFFQNCKKENRINKKMAGSWLLNEFNRAGGYTKSDFSQDKMSFEFKEYKNAYTKTMQGDFIIDYVDPNLIDVRETFDYQLKGNEIDITKMKIGSKYFNFLKKRFKIEEYKNDKLKLGRIDSTDLYIKATKQ